MKVDLTPELEAVVQRKVASGLFADASAVVREAPRLMLEQDRVRQAQVDFLRQSVSKGLDQLDRGEVVDGPRAVARLREETRSRRKAKKRG
jgi:antitoxin ParD1/3/4